MLSIKDLNESLERKYSLTEKVNHENDEINALLKQYIGKKNIPSKAIKAIEDAGIEINGIGDNISFKGPNGKELKGWGRNDRVGPKKPMEHKRWQPHLRNSNWDLSKNQSRYDPIASNSWDKVDLKGYLDSDRPDNPDYTDYEYPGAAGQRSAVDYWSGEVENTTAGSLRPYSDKYKNMKEKERRAKQSRDFERRNSGVLSDEEIEEKVREFRDNLIAKNNRNIKYNSEAEAKYDKAVADVDNYLKDLGVRS